MSKKTILTDKAPTAIGPYSQGVVSNGFLFTSGQLPIDPETGTIPDGSIEEKAHIAFRNLSAIAKKAGTSLDNTVKTTVFLEDINDFKAVNSIYAEYFREPFPARSAFQVAALPLGSEIEVEAVFKI